VCSKELGWPVRLMVLIVGLCLLLLFYFFCRLGFCAFESWARDFGRQFALFSIL
jgi:hypothetical protein